MDYKKLIQWFEDNSRDLPWRDDPTPYQVWISEVMLQQTQAATVIPYYTRWLKQFPTLKDLAQASAEEVLKCWEGLGYYSRARNLHAAAKDILKNYQGIIPSDPALLANIKGIGPYTLGAIRSFAFHQRCPAVDGNVIRVLSRHYLIQEDIVKAKTQGEIRELAEKILPEEKPWVMMEALIELGATVCQKVPKCHNCPIQSSCQANLHGMAHQLPFKSKKAAIQHLIRAVAVLQSENKLLVRQVEEGKIMSGLHEFPYVEIVPGDSAISKLQIWLKSHFMPAKGIKLSLVQALPEVAHTFTNYRVKLNPFHLKCPKPFSVNNYQWMTKEDLQKVAFPSGHRQIFALIKDTI